MKKTGAGNPRVKRNRFEVIFYTSDGTRFYYASAPDPKLTLKQLSDRLTTAAEFVRGMVRHESLQKGT